MQQYAKYGLFQVGSENTYYDLHVGKYTGDAVDSGLGMIFHNTMKFSTFDKDNDICRSNCAAVVAAVAGGVVGVIVAVNTY